MVVSEDIQMRKISRSPITVVRPNVRFLGDDLIQAERRRVLLAQRDAHLRQKRIRQIEREIEFNEEVPNSIVTEEEADLGESVRGFGEEIAITMECDSDSIDESVEPRTAAQWNQHIRQAIAKRNSGTVERPPIERPKQYIPSFTDMCWAVFWMIFVLSFFGTVIYRYHGAFFAIFKWFRGGAQALHIALVDLFDCKNEKFYFASTDTQTIDPSTVPAP